MKGSIAFRLTLALVLIIPVVLIIALPTPVLAATYTLEPKGPGHHTNLNVSGGGSNWAAASAPDGSPYVWWNQNGWRVDSYELPDVTLTGTINSVTVWNRARAASAASQEGVWPSIVTYDGTVFPPVYATYPVGAATQAVLGTTWADYPTPFPTNPYTGLPWTWDDINGLEAGVRLRQSGGGVQSQVDYVWIEIDYEPAASGTSGRASGPASVLLTARIMALVDEVLSVFVTVTPGTVIGCGISPMQANITCAGNNLISSLSNTISAGVAMIPKLLSGLDVS